MWSVSELKPCPFCQGEASARGADETHWIVCIQCAAEGPWRKSRVASVNAWNTRATPPRAEVDVEWEDGGRRYEVRSGALWIKVAPDPAPHGEWHMVDRKDALPVLVRRVRALSSPTPTDARDEGGV